MDPKRDEKLFQLAVGWLIDRIEGGQVNDAADKGGLTRYGISQKTYPLLNIATLKRSDAERLYWDDYWYANNCHCLPPELAVLVFDASVNHRAQVGVKLLQQALRITPVDGICGPKTQTAAMRANLADVVPLFLAMRADLYRAIIAADSSQARFATGWFKRLFLLQQFTASLRYVL
jgi:lysozyme family protein